MRERALTTTASADAAIGARIRLRRRQLGLTQARLAAELDVTFQQVQKYEKGTNRVAASRLPGLARLLKCSANYLLGVDGDDGASLDNQVAVWLATAGALELLDAYASISTPSVRGAMLQLTCALAAAEKKNPSGPPPYSRQASLRISSD